MAEEKTMVQQRVSLGGQGTTLIVSHTIFDGDGFPVGTKTALVEISLGKDPIDMVQKAAKKEWNLFGTKNTGGFVQAIPVRDLSDEEIAGTKSAGRSYTALIEATANGEDLVHGNNASLRAEPINLPVLK
jgi:hypothetical protein